MERKTKQDWLDAGIAILAADGATGLTVQRLTTEVGVTKGSFYHHFRGIADYVAHFLRHVEEEGTLNIIEICDREPTPEARLEKLIEISTSHPAALEVAMRTWALHDARVGEVQARVDARRIAYVEGLFLATQLPQQATLLAHMMYSLLLGSEHIIPPLESDVQRALLHQFLQQIRGSETGEHDRDESYEVR